MAPSVPSQPGQNGSSPTSTSSHRHSSSIPSFQEFSRAPYYNSAERSGYSPEHAYSPISSLPPVLPPIPRVASKHDSADPRPQTLQTMSDLPDLLSNINFDSQLPTSAEPQPSFTHKPKASSPVSLVEDARAVSNAPPILQKERSRSYTTPRSTSGSTLSKVESPRDSRSVSLAVPYATTAASTLPKLGNRPIHAKNTVNGVPQHARTSSILLETPTQRSSKRGLKLLNPVNLLLRRRSSQAPDVAADDASSPKSSSVPPAKPNYDPRIRGNTIHDFSAPRPRRNLSRATLPGNVEATASASVDVGESSNPEQDEELRPLHIGNANQKRVSDFREHFDDSMDDTKHQEAVNAESLANQNFLSRVSWQNGQTQDSSTLPPYGRKSQDLDPEQSDFKNGDWQTHPVDPSSMSSRPDISGSDRLPSSDRINSPSTMLPEVFSHDHTSPILSADEITMLSLTSTVGDRQMAPQTTSYSDETTHEERSSGLGLPKHFNSNASRFSFQMGGQDSIAEEKLLEEKSRVKRATTMPEEELIEAADEDDEDYTFDEDAMYDRDELEGMADFDQAVPQYGLGLGRSLAEVPPGTDLSNPGNGISASEFTINPPTDGQHAAFQDNVQGSQMTKSERNDREILQSSPDSPRSSSDYGDSDNRSDSHQGFPVSKSAAHLATPQLETAVEEVRKSRASHDFDDDLYWHDGAIDAVAEPSTTNLNEDDFDDPNFLRGGNAQNKDFTLSPYDEGQEPDAHDDCGAGFGMQNAIPDSIATDSPLSEKAVKIEVDEPILPGHRPPQPSRTTTAPLGQGLAAYHSALADSVQKAAAGGKFTRHASTATCTSAYSDGSGNAPSSIMPSEVVSREISRARPPPSQQTRDSYSGFDFGFSDFSVISSATPLSATFPVDAITTDDNIFGDDDFDADDAIISEANADALASDDEGFYGQEFGFYAKARPGSSDEDAINGGFFGEAGADGVVRKWSLKEPNLTPITERSEFSTRNSFIGPFSPGAAGPLTNPAFAAQIARLSPLALAHLHEEEMTMEHILRLRNQAFNGSDEAPRSESLSSMSSTAEASNGFAGPVQRGSWQTSGIGSQFMAKGGVPMAYQYSTGSSHSSTRMSRTQSDLVQDASVPPNNDEYAGYTQSPMVDSPSSTTGSRLRDKSVEVEDNDATPRKNNMNTNHVNRSPAVGTPGTPVPSSSPQTPGTAYKSSPHQTYSHSRNPSGADSVTYRREQDAAGKDRWVLERRRTSEAGLLELVGREVVEGGRI